MSAGTNISGTLTTSIPNAQSIIIQGLSNSTANTVSGIVNLYPSQGGTYWIVNLTVLPSGTSATTTYTVYYYGLS
jgi:hypothetical protein